LKYSANGNITLHKFIPEGLGITIPVSVTYNKDISTPRLLTGSDIVLTQDRQNDERSTSINEGISLPISIRPKKSHWLINSTLAAFTARFSFTRSRQWTPTTPYSEATGYIASADYKLKFAERLTFTPLFWARYLLIPKRLHATPLSILPSDFRAQGTINRRKSTMINSLRNTTDAYSRSFSGSSGLSLSPIPSVGVKFDMTTTRDMSLSDDVDLSFNPREFKFGRELAYTQNASASYRPSLVSFLTPTFSYSTAFNDKIDRTFNDHDIGGTRNWSVSGSFDPAKFWMFMGARDKGAKAATRSKPSVDKDAAARAKKPDDDPEKSDTTKSAETPKPQAGGGAMPIDAWRSLMGSLRWLTSPVGQTTLNYGRTDTDARKDLQRRPTWRYRFGIDLDEETPLSTTSGNSSQTLVNTRGEKETFSAKNQLNLFNLLNISSGYTKNRNSTIKSGSDNTTEGTIFPSLSTGLQRLERYVPFRWLFSSATARLGYERKIDQSFTNGQQQSETVSRAFTPLFSVQGTMKNGFTTNVVYETGSADSRQFVNRQKSHKTGSSVRVTGNYSFSSPNGIPLPILRGLRLRSTMSLAVSVNYKSDQTFTGPDSLSTLTLTSSSTSLSIAPTATYSFSLRMKGGITSEWTDRSDRSPTSGRRKSHVRSLGFWAEFTF
jgi:cell surface protein SprA